MSNTDGQALSEADLDRRKAEVEIELQIEEKSRELARGNGILD